MEHRSAVARRRPVTSRLPRHRQPLAVLAALLVLLMICGGCGTDDADLPPAGLPRPTCGGLKIAIDPSLPCERVAEIAISVLRQQAPAQLARGVTAIDVVLADCPRGEIPAQISCGNSSFAQLVTVTFGPGRAGQLVEPSLTVAVEPTTGAVLGIENPLIR
jgi:hypothetical protein